MSSNRSPTQPLEAGFFNEHKDAQMQRQAKTHLESAFDVLDLARTINKSITHPETKPFKVEKDAVKALIRNAGQHFILAKKYGNEEAKNVIDYIREQLYLYPKDMGYSKAIKVLKAIDDYTEMHKDLSGSIQLPTPK